MITVLFWTAFGLGVVVGVSATVVVLVSTRVR